MQNAAFAKLHVLADDRVGPNAYARRDFCAARDDGLFVDGLRAHFETFADSGVTASALLDAAAASGSSRSTMRHISVASAHRWPSTVARPSSLQKSRRQKTRFISMRNWSPGTTGRRK